MTLSTKILGGVAGFALSGALAFSGEGFAQSLSRSSPEEMAQTERLNADQDSTARQTEAMIAATDNANRSAYSQAQTQFNDAQARYQQQLGDYNNELKDYDARNQAFHQQADNFNAAKSDYNATIAAPIAPNVVVAAPPVVAQSTILATPETTTLVHLSALPNADADIAGAPVEDITGRTIGRFRHMTDVDEGFLKGLIELNNSKVVAVPDEDLRFDQDHGVVVAARTYDELRRLPGRL